jgi:hypothetical protein
MAVEEPTIGEVAESAKELAEVHGRIAHRFARAAPRGRAPVYLRGLLSTVERKNGWQLAEEAGARTPDGMQRLLCTAEWYTDAVRDELVAYVPENVADPGAGLALDETGLLQKGRKSAGVVVKSATYHVAGALRMFEAGDIRRCRFVPMSPMARRPRSALRPAWRGPSRGP